MVHEITQKVRKLLRKYINVPSNIFKMAKDSKLKKRRVMEVENKPQPMAGFAVGILSPGKRTDQVCLPSLNKLEKEVVS